MNEIGFIYLAAILCIVIFGIATFIDVAFLSTRRKKGREK